MPHRVRYAAVSILIASVPVALMALGSRSAGEPGQPIEPLWQVLAYAGAQWYPWAAVAPFIDRTVRRARGRGRRDRVAIFAQHAALLTVFTVLHYAVVTGSIALIHRDESTRLPRLSLGELLPDTLLYIALAVGFTIAESRRRQTEVAERLRAEVAEARLDALRQQLNPHFLFNTLNHIVAQLRSRDVEPAIAMLLALSDLLRDVLRERAQLIPFSDEVRMVERYLEIARARFGDRLQAAVTFEPKALDALVPSLVLQPLLENAVRHGVSTSDGVCRLSVTARVSQERLTIEVQDGGPGLPQDAGAAAPGIGLTNTRQRLAYLYGPDHTFELRTLQGGGLLVSLDLPFRRS